MSVVFARNQRSHEPRHLGSTPLGDPPIHPYRYNTANAGPDPLYQAACTFDYSHIQNAPNIESTNGPGWFNSSSEAANTAYSTTVASMGCTGSVNAVYPYHNAYTASFPGFMVSPIDFSPNHYLHSGGSPSQGNFIPANIGTHRTQPEGLYRLNAPQTCDSLLLDKSSNAGPTFNDFVSSPPTCQHLPMTAHAYCHGSKPEYSTSTMTHLYPYGLDFQQNKTNTCQAATLSGIDGAIQKHSDGRQSPEEASNQTSPRSGTSSSPPAKQQQRRHPDDLYTAPFVRGTGAQREGYCPLCKRWRLLKTSAFWYDKTYGHGISQLTGRPFDDPVEYRFVSKDKPSSIGSNRHARARHSKSSNGQTSQRQVEEGRCGSCGVWVVLSRKTGSQHQDNAQIPSNRLGMSWVKHAHRCHSRPRHNRSNSVSTMGSISTSVSATSASTSADADGGVRSHTLV